MALPISATVRSPPGCPSAPIHPKRGGPAGVPCTPTRVHRHLGGCALVGAPSLLQRADQVISGHARAVRRPRAFMQEHRHGGELDGGVDGERVWLACDCGAGAAHPIRPSSDACPGGRMKVWPTQPPTSVHRARRARGLHLPLLSSYPSSKRRSKSHAAKQRTCTWNSSMPGLWPSPYWISNSTSCFVTGNSQIAHAAPTP